MDQNMNGFAFTLAGAALVALPSGALHWPDAGLLCVSDLHLGKSSRIARREGRMLPPYETRATLDRLEADLAATGARRVICLGDNFDDLTAAEDLNQDQCLKLVRLQAGRDWIWIEGNHDPGPAGLGGQHCAVWRHGDLSFRHIATPSARGEISGHYHPKCGPPGTGFRPVFLIDGARVILPAYGAYTGGLRCTDAALQALMTDPALAVLTGPRAVPMPLPRRRRGR